MEMLEPLRVHGKVELEYVAVVLESEIWTRPTYRDWRFGWLTHLQSWASSYAPWTRAAIDAAYPEEPPYGYSLIHGDPTLINLMRRGSQLILTDPMPRLEYRREIPNRPEVDVGKLIQSAMGWEYILSGNGLAMQESIVLNRFPKLARLGCLWAAIHLARVAVRAPKRGRLDIAGWAEECSVTMIEQFGRMR